MAQLDIKNWGQPLRDCAAHYLYGFLQSPLFSCSCYHALTDLPLPPDAVPYIKSSIIPNIVGPLVILAIAVILLFSFLMWRLIK